MHLTKTFQSYKTSNSSILHIKYASKKLLKWIFYLHVQYASKILLKQMLYLLTMVVCDFSFPLLKLHIKVVNILEKYICWLESPDITCLTMQKVIPFSFLFLCVVGLMWDQQIGSCKRYAYLHCHQRPCRNYIFLKFCFFFIVFFSFSVIYQISFVYYRTLFQNEELNWIFDSKQ